MDGRYWLARLRALEEALQRDLDDVEASGYRVKNQSKDGRFFAGQASGLLAAKGKVQRLREHLSAELARQAR